MTAAWTWAWLPRSTGQHFGDNPVFDLIRLVVIAASVNLLWLCLRVILEQRRRAVLFPPGQVARFVALAGFDLYIAITEVAVLGTTATPRLVVGLVFNVIAWYGVRRMRHRQRRQPIVR